MIENKVNIAAAGDLHLGYTELSDSFFNRVNTQSDLLLLAGDLTMDGRSEEIDLLKSHLSKVDIPTLMVLGNHDHHSRNEDVFADIALDLKNVTLLNGELAELTIRDKKIAVLGLEGFGGGFKKNNPDDFTQEFIEAWQDEASLQIEKISPALDKLKAEKYDYKIALLHYMPFAVNMGDESSDTEFLLGSEKMGEMLIEHGFDLVLHGHAHRGAAGVFQLNQKTQVANVALPVNKDALSFFCF